MVRLWPLIHREVRVLQTLMVLVEAATSSQDKSQADQSCAVNSIHSLSQSWAQSKMNRSQMQLKILTQMSWKTCLLTTIFSLKTNQKKVKSKFLVAHHRKSCKLLQFRMVYQRKFKRQSPEQLDLELDSLVTVPLLWNFTQSKIARQ